MLSLSDFENFRTLIGRRRNYNARMLGINLAGRINTPEPENLEIAPYPGWSVPEWTHESTKFMEKHDDQALLIEDVDIRCILALDAKFGLDPRFILSYLHTRRSYLAETGTTGSWFTAFGTTAQRDPRQSDDRQRPKRKRWEGPSTLWRRTKSTSVSSAYLPW